MSRVFLFTGFNNWGKTTLLGDVFGTKVFRTGVAERFGGSPFLVMPQSNDDLGKRGYERDYRDRLQKYTAALGAPKFIAAAFCPTQEIRNDSIAILRNLFPGAKIEMLLLEYKWCGQAKLLVPKINAHYVGEKNVTIHRISSKDRKGRELAAGSILGSYLP